MRYRDLKISKKTTLLAAAVLFIFSLTMSCVGPTAEPWKVIFNGVDFEGWTVIGDLSKTWIEDSAFVCQRVVNTTEHGFIRTNEKYGDFILECDNKIDSTFNSGILFRCFDVPDTSAVCIYGYQVKLDPSKRAWTGGIFLDYGDSWHWLYTLENDARARAAYKLGEWNHFRIEAIGSSLKVWVNGIPTCNLINAKYDKGYIAFKIHSLPKNNNGQAESKGYFKNIRIITESPEKYAKEMDIPPLAAD